MNEKTAAQLYAELVVGFNNYVDVVTEYFKLDNYIRQADFTQLHDLAQKSDVYICDNTTLDELREGILSHLKAQILNHSLQIKKSFTFTK